MFWLATDQEREMSARVERELWALVGQERQLRTFCALVCREVWRYLGEDGRKAVEMVERVARGEGSAEELETARVEAMGSANLAYPGWVGNLPVLACLPDALESALACHRARLDVERDMVGRAARVRFRDVPDGRHDLSDWLAVAIERDCLRATERVAGGHLRYLRGEKR